MLNLEKPNINLLKDWSLVIAGDDIKVEVTNKAYLDNIEAIFQSDTKATFEGDGRIQSALRSLSTGGGKLHKGLHKSLHKGLHKGLHKAKTSGAATDTTGIQQWAEIEVPWRELKLLHKKRVTYKWHELELAPPKPIKERLEELVRVRELQNTLREPDQAWRRARIVTEAGNDLTAYMNPLGGNVASPGSPTALMFQTILWLGADIGLEYKARYNSERPNVLDPQIEPFIPVPIYSSYPSNHSFQSHLIAEVFARAVPEHPGLLALFRAAWDVAVNREYAGLHTRSETEAGLELARMCAPLFEDILEEQIINVREEMY